MKARYTRTKDRPPIDWKKPVALVAAELGISLSRAYQLRDSYRRARPADTGTVKGSPRGNTTFRDPEAELAWLIDTIQRAERVLKAARADFGKVLRHWRKGRKMKQVTLSALIWPGGNPRRNADVSRIEAGDTPHRDFIDRLDAYLKGGANEP